MATLPPKSNFTDTAVTQGGFRAALDQLRDYLAGLLGEQGTAADARATLGLGPLATLSLVSNSMLDNGAVSTSKIAWNAPVGSWTLGANGGVLIIPAGLYMFTYAGNTVVVDVNDSGTWYELGPGNSVGAVFSDGINVRVRNPSGIVRSVRYRQLA